jgi:hypothetical protein
MTRQDAASNDEFEPSVLALCETGVVREPPAEAQAPPNAANDREVRYALDRAAIAEEAALVAREDLAASALLASRMLTEADATRREVRAVEATHIFRASAGARSVYARLRRFLRIN